MTAARPISIRVIVDTSSLTGLTRTVPGLYTWLPERSIDVHLTYIFGDHPDLVALRVVELSKGEIVDIDCSDAGLKLMKLVCTGLLFDTSPLIRVADLHKLSLKHAASMRDAGTHSVLAWGVEPLPGDLVVALGTGLQVEHLGKQHAIRFLRQQAAAWQIEIDADGWKRLAFTAETEPAACWSVLRALRAAHVEHAPTELVDALCHATVGVRPWNVLDDLLAGRLTRGAQGVEHCLSGFVGYLSRLVEDTLLEHEGGQPRSNGYRQRTALMRRWGPSGLVEALYILDVADQSYKSGKPPDAVGARLIGELAALISHSQLLRS